MPKTTPSTPPWHLRTLRAKLLLPIAGLMLISLLGSTLAFVAGTALTQTQLLQKQITDEFNQFRDALNARITELDRAATLLVNDPHVFQSIQVPVNSPEAEDAQRTLNARAVAVRNRFGGLDLIQFANAEGQLRTNLLSSSLYRETSVLGEAEGERAAVRIIEDRALILKQADIREDQGTLVIGLDLESELEHIVKNSRLTSDLGLLIEVQGTIKSIGTQKELPFDAPEGRGDGIYTQQFAIPIGNTTHTLLMVRPTTDIARITRTGLAVVVGSTVVTTGLLLGLSVVITGGIARPIQHLSEAASAVEHGDLERRAKLDELPSMLAIGSEDEIGALAASFNSMVQELQSLYGTLEAKVAARTHELETAAEVARTVSSSLDLNAVLQMAVHLIRTRLGFYATSIYTVEPGKHRAVLQEAVGYDEGHRGKKPIDLHSNTLVGTTASVHSPCVVQNVETELRYLETAWPPETRSAAAVPLLIGKDVIGVMEVHSKENDAFPPETVNLLSTLGDQIAVGLQNAQLYKSEQERRRFAEVLELTGRVVTGSLDMQEVPGRILSMLNALVPYQRGSLWIQEGDEIRAIAHYGYPDERRIQNTTRPIREGDVFHKLTQRQQPIIIDDVTLDPRWNQLPWLPIDKSWLGVPILAKGKVIGMVSLTRSAAGAFGTEDADYVQAFTLQAAVALENARLYDDIARFNEQLEHMVAERTEELNHAYNILEKLEQAKSHFIVTAAHELRTPLTVIKAYGQMLKQFIHSPASPTIERAIHGIITGSERLHEIVNSMLDVARIDNQLIRVVRAEVSLADLVGYTQENFNNTLEERSLTFTSEGLDALPNIQADRALLHKVFHHLIVNAIKYTPDGGSITVSGSVVDGEDGPAVEIVVSDTGIGIDPEHQNLIFEKFYQTGEVAFHSSGRTKFKGGGPGLGLAIARGIVLAHGGTIWVESDGHDEERCPGASFFVRLPISRQEKQDEPQKQAMLAEATVAND